jgi:endonuclease/exonuclease/phosphatase family metal-dependent hydrolase
MRVGLDVRLMACLLCVTAIAGCSQAPASPTRTRANYTLMQMNLCLSGLAGCYPKTAYPAVLQEAVARIRATHPDAVTVNEACGRDVALIARRTGYHLRFSRVIYAGKPFTCIRPGGRGLFGDAVLTKAPIATSQAHPFKAQSGPERRQWICVTTQAGVGACTAHLATHEPEEAAANAPQCGELHALLVRRAASGHPVIFGGDVNRLSSCAPSGFWTRTDGSAFQDPGSQQVYGTRDFRSPTVKVIPALHTDHDILVVRSALRTRPVAGSR